MSAAPVTEPTTTRVPRFPFPLRMQLRRAGGSGAGGASGTTSGHRTWNGHDRRSADRLRRLARDYDALCTGAVDAAEIAAGLEASGFTDGSAKEYGYPGVFELAEQLYRSTPRLADRSPGRLANPWAERPLRHLARGLTFALPGLVLVACLPAVTSGADLAALIAAMLFGWPASQVMAFLGYALEGRRHPRGAAAVLLLTLAACVLAAEGLAVLARWWGASPTVTAIASAEIVYVGSAAVVLVLSNEFVILGALVPGLVAAGWVHLDAGAPRWLLTVGAAVSVGLVTIAAVVTCARAGVRDLRAGLRALTRHDGVEVLFHLGYGLAGGALVTLPVVAGPRTVAGGLALMPVIWSMGSAEWNVVRLRRRSFDLLNEAISVRLFHRSVRRLAATGVSRYLAELSVLVGLMVGGIRLTTGALPDAQLAVALLAAWVLGAGLFLALVLSSLGRVRAVVPYLLLAFALGLTADVASQQVFAALVGPLALVIGLAPTLGRTIADPVRHM